MSRFSSPPVWLRICCVASLLASGCRSSSSDTNRELLINELRLLEDDIYELEGDLDAKEQQLEATKRENELLKKELTALGKQGMSTSEDPLPRAPNAARPGLLMPVKPAPKPVQPMQPELIEPLIEAPALPGGQGRREQASPYRPAQYAVPIETQETVARIAEVWGPALTAAPSAVDHIAIHPRLTGGRDRDRTPGDDGILVVFAPRDADDRALQVRGSVQIALVDATANARTARWEFSGEEADKWFKKSMLGGEAYHFELPWPTRAPENARQTLHVRFATADGNRYEATHDVHLDLTGERRAQPVAHLAAPRNPRMTPNNDPPPAWNGGIAPSASSTGPALTAPAMGSLSGSGSNIDIQIPDIGGVTADGKNAEPIPRSSRSRLRGERRSRIFGAREAPAPPPEAGPLVMPQIEASGIPGGGISGNPPATSLPGAGSSTKPQPFWRSLFQQSPTQPATTAPAATPPSPVARPRGFLIVPEGGAAPLNSSGGIPSTPAPLYATPPGSIPLGGPDSGYTPLPAIGPIQTANERPEWKPYR